MVRENWSDKKIVKKGIYGENLVKNYLRTNGYLIYTQDNSDIHPFDILAVKDYNDLMFVEVKTKARMNKYYATGFNNYQYDNYTRLTDLYRIPLFLYFVDEHPKEKRIYGNYLHILSQQVDVNGEIYPKILGNVILFHLSTMKDIIKLSDNDCLMLQQLSTRTHNYQ